MPDEATENKGATTPSELDLVENEVPEKPPTPLERFLKKFREAGRGSKPTSPTTRKELGKDRSKTLFVLVAAAVAVILFFFAIFSSPQKTILQHHSRPVLLRRCSTRRPKTKRHRPTVK
jgi:hypothetical protein